jgi:hypothetical protein
MDERAAEIREQLMELEIRCGSLAGRIEQANAGVYVALGHYRRARRVARKAMTRAWTYQLIAMHGARQMAGLRAELQRLREQAENLEYHLGRGNPAVVQIKADIRELASTIASWSESRVESHDTVTRS